MSPLSIALVGSTFLSVLVVPIHSFSLLPIKSRCSFQKKGSSWHLSSHLPETRISIGSQTHNNSALYHSKDTTRTLVDNNKIDKTDSFLRSATKNIVPSVMLLASVMAFSTFVEPANAVLGAGGAVVTSPAIVKSITLEEWINLPEKKQRQYEGGFLSCNYAVEPQPVTDMMAKKGFSQRKPYVKKICKPTNLIDELLNEIDVLSKIDPDRADTFRLGAENLLARERLMDRQNIESQLGQQPKQIYFACAFLASCVATSIMHPLDTLKVRLMSGKAKVEEEEIDDNEDNLVIAAGNKEESSDADIFATLADLYEGILPNLLKEGPASALYLGIYEYARTKLGGVPFLADNPLLIYLLAGSIGEFVGSVVRSPAEAVKTRVQTGLYDVAGAVENVFFTADGRKNTLIAWSAGLFRDVPHGAILIATFELGKTLIVDSSLDIDVNTLLSEALLGGFGGALGAFVSTPSDVVTTKIITSIEDGGEPTLPQDVLAKIWNEEGLKGIFSGVTERIIYWALSYGIFLSVYCSIRQYALELFK